MGESRSGLKKDEWRGEEDDDEGPRRYQFSTGGNSVKGGCVMCDV